MKKKKTIISKDIQNDSKKTLNRKWEKHLNDYLNYTKEYIEHYQKSLDGNSTSLSLYPYMKARSESLLEQLYEARQKSFLTEKQIERMIEIQTSNSYFIQSL